MDHFHKLTDCTELERLAAAAVTMGYSDTLVPVAPSSQSSASDITEQGHPSHYDNAYYILPQSFNARQPQHYDHHPHSEPQQIITENSTPQMIQINQHVNEYEHIENYAPSSQFSTGQSEIQQPTEVSQPINNSAISYNSDMNLNTSVTPQNNQKNLVNKVKNEKCNEQNESIGKIIEHKRKSHPTTKAISGDYVYQCDQCDEHLSSESQLQQHQQELHSTRRTGLALDVKIEIIKRISSGEKQADIADEYGVKRSTIKSLMLKADNYLSIWKKGSFHPSSKRLKGPKREDIEKVLYAWYQQTFVNGTSVTGSILCSKALDFAQKLGHTDFKATHGWLDRFKKRKNIVFGRTSNKKRRVDDEQLKEIKPAEWQQNIVPQLLTEFQPNDIFAVEETGLLYKSSPLVVPSMNGNRCAAGVKAKQRLTLVLCANLTGSEKFPLLVIGQNAKPASVHQVKSLPVQYICNLKSWITEEGFTAWLNDIDSWAVQQGRKICIIASNLPIHSKPLSLRAVKLVIAPKGFIGPLRQGPITALKCHYKRCYLETLLGLVSKERTMRVNYSTNKVPSISLMTAFDLLSSAWVSVTDIMINSGFQRSGIIKYGAWGISAMTEPGGSFAAAETMDRLKDLGLRIPDISFKDFVHFDDKVQVCNLMDDDDILAVVKKSDSADDESSGDEDNSIANDGTARLRNGAPTLPQVEKALGTLRQHIQYQEGAQEMFRVLANLEYLINKSHSSKFIPTHHSNHHH